MGVGASKKPETKIFEDMYRQGLDIHAIADRTGYHRQKVYSAIRRSIARGNLKPRERPATPKLTLRRSGLNMGSIRELCNALSPDQLDWLCEETLKVGCESIGEYLEEIVRDLHAEHTMAGEQADKK